MNEDDERRVQQKVHEEFQLGRARLFSLKNEKKLRAEIAEDKERLFELFRSQVLSKQLEFTECLARLLMNFSKMASYRGILKGFEIKETAIKLHKDNDRAQYHLFAFLQEHSEAKNKELIACLNTRNGRHQELKTPHDDPQWAPLPPPLRKRFGNRKIDPDEWWDTAMTEFPDEVRIYLARVKREAKKVEVKNVLFNWPKLVELHKKERKKKKV
jgi:hypothetical protein